MTEQAVFAVLGLGTMGRNLALNVEEKGFPTAVWNRRPGVAREFARRHEGKAFTAADSLEELVASVERPRRLMLMVPAGDPVDSMKDKLAPLLDEGDILVDGGNSHFENTRRRCAELAERGILFLGTGVSGGEEGARHGPSLMPGGPEEAWERCKDVLEAVAAKTDSGPCVTWCGPDGAGHFVKMVHNGIEYGIMQLLAETYDLLHRGLGWDAERTGELFARWNDGPLESFLVEITAQIFRVRDEDGAPLVEKVLDQAGQKGTGRWTVVHAFQEAVSVPTVAAAVDARVLSALRERRLRLEDRIEGPEPRVTGDAAEGLAEAMGEALHASVVCSYAQGMELIRDASDEHGWKVDLGEIARIWKGGCIIRARLLDDIMEAYRQHPGLESLLEVDPFRELLERHQDPWRRVVGVFSSRGIPAPAHASSLAWFDACRSGRLPQNLTQAQRDAFGAHTYRRLDDPPGAEARHTDWLDQAE